MDRTFEAGTLTREQFIDWMSTDVIAAKLVYDALNKTAARKSWREAKMSVEQRLKDFYSRKYKRPATIDKYVSEEMAEWCQKNKWRYTVRELKSIAWSIKPWENGECYFIDINDKLEKRLGDIYDMSIDNKYFKSCTGWAIGDDNYVHLILNDTMQAEWDADEKRLEESINKFYANSNYWGD